MGVFVQPYALQIGFVSLSMDYEQEMTLLIIVQQSYLALHLCIILFYIRESSTVSM